MGVATTCAAGFGKGIWKIEKNLKTSRKLGFMVQNNKDSHRKDIRFKWEPHYLPDAQKEVAKFIHSRGLFKFI